MHKDAPRQIHEIDALRGIAAVLVAFVFHSGLAVGHFWTGPLDGLPVFTWLHDYGWTMVDLFFVISGFVFAHAYLSDGAMRPGVTGRKFAVARIARLYPLHVLTLFLMAAVLMLTGVAHQELRANFDLYHLMLNLLMLQESGLNDGYSFNHASWSISVEIFCYAVFAIGAIMGRTQLRIIAVLALLVGLAGTTTGHPTAVHIARGFVGFFAGYFTWHLRHTKCATATLVVATVLPLLYQPPHIIYGAFLSLTAWPAATLLALRLPILAAPVFRWFGDRSYSIYLLHGVVYLALFGFVHEGARVPPAQWPLTIAAAVAITLVLSDLSYRYFERPMRQWLRAKLDAPNRTAHLKSRGLAAGPSHPPA